MELITETSPSPVKKTRAARRTTAAATAVADTASTTASKKNRKSKTAKVVVEETMEPIQIVSNVILHLKCTMSDLEKYDSKINRLLLDPLKYDPSVPPEVGSYDSSTTLNASEYETTQQSIASSDTDKELGVLCAACSMNNKIKLMEDEEDTDAEKRELKQKLKELKIQLYKNTIDSDKKSACFWDTCEYDNPPCRIPLYIAADTIYGYGSFCRPECAVAHLFEENLDDSTKFERYQLINRIYGPIYNYKKNIKPAPSPYYTLDKYYGEFTIQEYRRLLKSEHLLMVVEKPFTRVLPELHEDSDELMTSVYGINKSVASTGGVYKVKRQSEKSTGPSKSSVLADKFSK